MEKTRKPIANRVRRIMMLVSLLVLVACGAIAVISMFMIRNRVTSDSRSLGDQATQIAADNLTAQMEQNRKNVADSRADYADAQLNRLSGYVGEFKSYIEYLYKNKNLYDSIPVLPPDSKNKGKLTLMRDLATEDVKVADIKDEMGLLGNVEPIFNSVYEVTGEEIATMYLGTESGVLISYDVYSTTSDSPDGESYYNFREAGWYQQAKEKDGIIFTDTYQDGYGRGLTISCAAPFYNEKGEFAGVVSMDILIDDLVDSIIDLESNDGSYVMLVTSEGDIIASPYVDRTAENLGNITKDPSDPIFEVSNRILSGSSGITRTASNVYYSYAAIGLTNWTLIICIPAESITEPVNAIADTIQSGTQETVNIIDRTIGIVIFLLIFAFAAILIGVLFVSNKVSKRLIDPLIGLRNDVMRISGGDLSYRAEVVENDEIGDLATAFNNMSASLTEYIDDLTKVTAEKERIGAELNVATQIQADMLPSIFPPFPERTEFDIYATMTPAKEVGGDFYDFFLVDDDHLAMVMADVSGKGVPAALFMVIAKTLIKNRTQMASKLSPSEILIDVNNQLCEGNEAELFVTVWLGILQISTGKGIAANAGHEHPAIKRVNGSFELVKSKHSPAVATMEGIKFREHEFELNHGDTLYVYTDGVPEATNASDELFGTDRMLEALNSVGDDASMQDMLAAVKASVDSFVGEAPQFDDLTQLGFKLY